MCVCVRVRLRALQKMCLSNKTPEFSEYNKYEAYGRVRCDGTRECTTHTRARKNEIKPANLQIYEYFRGKNMLFMLQTMFYFVSQRPKNVVYVVCVCVCIARIIHRVIH